MEPKPPCELSIFESVAQRGVTWRLPGQVNPGSIDKLTLFKNSMSVVFARRALWQTSRQSVMESSWTQISQYRINQQSNKLGTAVTHETVDFGILFEREVEREGREENDGLDVIEERYPMLALLSVAAKHCIHHPHIHGEA